MAFIVDICWYIADNNNDQFLLLLFNDIRGRDSAISTSDLKMNYT